MKRLLLSGTFLISIYCCSNNSIKGSTTFDNNDYYYSADSLKSPMIFIYIDNSSGEKLYQKIESENAIDGRIVTTTFYDSSFRQTYFEKNKIGKDSIKIIDFSYIIKSTQKTEKLIIAKYFNPRIKKIGDSPSYIIESIKPRSIEDIGRKLSTIGHYSRNAPPSGQSNYNENDCIEMTCQNIMTPLDTSQIEQPFPFNSTFYYAKNIGLIYFEISDPSGQHIKRVRLEKIIYLSDFEKMKKDHSSADVGR